MGNGTGGDSDAENMEDEISPAEVAGLNSEEDQEEKDNQEQQTEQEQQNGGNGEEHPADISGTETPGITEGDTRDDEVSTGRMTGVDGEKEDFIDENNREGQSRDHEVSEKSRQTAQKRDQFHEKDEFQVGKLADDAREYAKENAVMQSEFNEEVDERTEKVEKQKDELDEEIEPEWEDRVSYDREDAGSFVGWGFGRVAESDIQEFAMDAGFFSTEMFDFNDLFSAKKRVDGSEYQADAEAANRRSRIVDASIQDLHDSLEHVQTSVEEIVEDIGLETQWDNFEDRKGKYEQVKGSAENAIEAWVETKSESDPDESGRMLEGIRNVLGIAADEAPEDVSRKKDFESEQQELLHKRMWRSYQAKAARSMQDQLARIDDAVTLLENLDENIASEIDMYISVREGMENLDVFDKIDDVGDSVYDALQDKDFNTLYDIAKLDSEEDLRDHFGVKSFEEGYNGARRVRKNAEEIYETARSTALDLAENWGLKQETQRIEDNSEDEYEDRVLKQVAGIYLMAGEVESELESARNPLDIVEEYREKVDEMEDYVESEVEETYKKLNELEDEELEIPTPQI